MSDIPVEFDFVVDKDFVKSLGKLPAVRAGILKDQKLWSWKKETRSLGNGITGNKIQQGRQWGDDTVGSTLASVFANTSIIKEFTKLLEKKGQVLLADVIARSPEEYKSAAVKRAANSFAALLKQAYVAMSKKRRNSPKRAAQKGFNAYAIGTGQTLTSIKAEVYEQ